MGKRSEGFVSAKCGYLSERLLGGTRVKTPWVLLKLGSEKIGINLDNVTMFIPDGEETRLFFLDGTPFNIKITFERFADCLDVANRD